MKLKNKETGEVVPASNIAVGIGKDGKWYDSLAELNAEWEDYEEPEEYWHIDFDGSLMQTSDIKVDKCAFDKLKEIGNYFDTREEAEKALEKLKAVKQLKDAGCRVTEYKTYGGTTSKGEFIGEVKIILDVPDVVDKELLDLLFGGEE